MRALLVFVAALTITPLQAQQPDTDHDGLNDALEQRLLQQFAPGFHIGQHDCSAQPASFLPGITTPTVAKEDGTIYGQAFLAKSSTPQHPAVELHYYHLWRADCGAHGHPLDTEHVAALIRPDSTSLDTAHWQAAYWFAAAHENTVCDVSQITRAATIHAENTGADIWVSPGKHASYLNETLCKAGCGNDRCLQMTALPHAAIINLGEPGAPMNQSAFISSPAWPLAAKMSTTNFPAEPLARLEQLPTTDIAWYNPGRHPAQGIIAISSHTQQSIAGASANTSTAISLARRDTGNALSRSYHKTTHALGTAAHNTGEFLHTTPAPASHAPDTERKP